MNSGLDSWKLLRASRRLRESMRATRAEMSELRADCESDGGIPRDVKRLDAMLTDIEQRSRAVLVTIAALLRRPTERRWRIQREH